MPVRIWSLVKEFFLLFCQCFSLDTLLYYLFIRIIEWQAIKLDFSSNLVAFTLTLLQFNNFIKLFWISFLISLKRIFSHWIVKSTLTIFALFNFLKQKFKIFLESKFLFLWSLSLKYSPISPCWTLPR